MKNLGQLEKVNLREIWQREDTHFTNWLAEDKNISILMDEIGVTAENVKTEDRAGRFNCDITADEVETSKKIIIENQLEKTDHSHLGQLLTYASSFDASIIVWVVAEVTDEHKQAIEWFNRNMIDKISFFLVKVELWKIGNSEPAPKFNIIVEPNDWAKITYNKSSYSNEMTDRKLMNLSFWQGLVEFSDNNHNDLKITRKPRPQHWYSTSSTGVSKVDITFIVASRDSYVAVQLYISDQEIYDKLEEKKLTFNEFLNGLDVVWMPLPDKKASRIITKFKCDVNNEDNWEDYYKWIIKTGEGFLNAFKKTYNK